MDISLAELKALKTRAKSELKANISSNGFHWDAVVEALCDEVIRLKVQCKEILTAGYLHMEKLNDCQPTVVELPDNKSPLKEIYIYGPHKLNQLSA